MTGFADVLAEQAEQTHDAFIRSLSPAVRARVLRRRRDPLAATQDDLDAMTDDEKWAWLESAIAAEHDRAATAAQTTIPEGHP